MHEFTKVIEKTFDPSKPLTPQEALAIYDQLLQNLIDAGEVDTKERDDGGQTATLIDQADPNTVSILKLAREKYLETLGLTHPELVAQLTSLSNVVARCQNDLSSSLDTPGVPEPIFQRYQQIASEVLGGRDVAELGEFVQALIDLDREFLRLVNAGHITFDESSSEVLVSERAPEDARRKIEAAANNVICELGKLDSRCGEASLDQGIRRLCFDGGDPSSGETPPPALAVSAEASVEAPLKDPLDLRLLQVYPLMTLVRQRSAVLENTEDGCVNAAMIIVKHDQLVLDMINQGKMVIGEQNGEKFVYPQSMTREEEDQYNSSRTKLRDLCNSIGLPEDQMAQVVELLNPNLVYQRLSLRLNAPQFQR